MNQTKFMQEDDGGMTCLEFAKVFLSRTNHPGFKIVVADCIDEIEQLETQLSVLEEDLRDILHAVNMYFAARDFGDRNNRKVAEEMLRVIIDRLSDGG
jgi:hypothetical protein